MTHNFYEHQQTSESYSKYRPTYGKKVVESCMEYIRSKCQIRPKDKINCLFEVGCGTGVATQVFAPYFNKVLATDISEMQIEKAKLENKFSHVQYSLGSAEDIACGDKTVDVLLAAEAAHWFDYDKFFSEATRVLKKNGCLILLVYTTPKLTPVVHGVTLGKLKEFTSELLHKANSFSCLSENSKGNHLDVEVYNRGILEVRNHYPSIFEAIPSKCKEQSCIEQPCDGVWDMNNLEGLSSSLGKHSGTEQSNSTEKSINKACGSDVLSFYNLTMFQEDVKAKLTSEGYASDDLLFKAIYEVGIIKACQLEL